MSAPIPAATLVLFREVTGGPAEHLFVERAATMSFAAGALVFPGGRVEPGDGELARSVGALGIDDATARVAAIRETIEEGGVAVGLSPPPDEALVDRLRTGLLAGQPFAGLLSETGLSLDLAQLIPFSRWCPNLPKARVFDTRFYLARMPVDHPAARVDESENVRVLWASARRVLDQANEGSARIIFPTRCNLERFAALETFEAAVAQVATLERPPRLIEPWIEERDGAEHLCIPEGQGYPTTSQRLPEAIRG